MQEHKLVCGRAHLPTRACRSFRRCIISSSDSGDIERKHKSASTVSSLCNEFVWPFALESGAHQNTRNKDIVLVTCTVHLLTVLCLNSVRSCGRQQPWKCMGPNARYTCLQNLSSTNKEHSSVVAATFLYRRKRSPATVLFPCVLYSGRVTAPRLIAIYLNQTSEHISSLSNSCPQHWCRTGFCPGSS